MESEIAQIILGAGVGLTYGLYGFLTKRGRNEPLQTEKLARTVLLFSVAGAISVYVNGDVSEVAINSQVTAMAGTLGLAFDMLWSHIEREIEIPETIPTGAEPAVDAESN